MATDWAAKLAQAATQPTNSTQPTQPTQPKLGHDRQAQPKPDKKVKTSRSPSRSPPPTFNPQEIKQFLHTNYQSYLTKAREDKDGEQYKVYKSLESSNQWETQVVNPRNVLRNRPQSNTVDIIFEINRSIYQQRQGEKK